MRLIDFNYTVVVLSVLGFVLVFGLVILIRTCCFNCQSYKSHKKMVSQFKQRQEPPSYEEAIKLPATFAVIPPTSSRRLNSFPPDV